MTTWGSPCNSLPSCVSVGFGIYTSLCKTFACPLLAVPLRNDWMSSLLTLLFLLFRFIFGIMISLREKKQGHCDLLSRMHTTIRTSVVDESTRGQKAEHVGPKPNHKKSSRTPPMPWDMQSTHPFTFFSGCWFFPGPWTTQLHKASIF
jgi:hypothetical protein